MAFLSQIAAVEQAERDRGRAAALTERIRGYIDEHLGDNLSVNTLAELLCLSPNYLSKLFKAGTGCGLAAYISGRRMDRARELLLETSY